MNHRDQSLAQRTRRLLTASVAALSLGLLSLSGFSYANEGFPGPHGNMGMHHHGPMDEAGMEKHLDRMLGHLLPDLTDAQKTSIKSIAKAAHTDLKTLHDQHKTLRKAHLSILTAATVDRNALEQNRVEDMRLMEQISKRKNQALADAADVLTAAQRAKIGETLKAKMERRMMPGTMRSPFGK